MTPEQELRLLKCRLEATESWLADFRCCGTIMATGIGKDGKYFACSKCGTEWVKAQPK